MAQKSKAQKNEGEPESPPKEIAVCPEVPPFSAMTSRDYKRLRQGQPDEKQVSKYIDFPDSITARSILERELQSTTAPEPQEYQQAIERSETTHRQIVWGLRKTLVEGMNRHTLERLAEHYEIPPNYECIENHPDANDLDKGLLLARLRQFLWWNAEYFGTAPEMRDINVEAALAAGITREKLWNPSDTEDLESVLLHASACKSANSIMLLEALRDCIAVKCICPAHEKKMNKGIKYITYGLGDINNLPELKEKLRIILAYLTDFTPGKTMPEIVIDATDKWLTAQFAKGKPVSSIVRVAWLADVFHSFWEQHQSAYLASDPIQREKQKKATADGELGGAAKADIKWTRFTSLFAKYARSAVEPIGKLSLEERQALVDRFGQHLMYQGTKGATDKRSVAKIKNFMFTLLTLMDRNDGGDLIQSTWQELRAEREDQRKDKGSGDFFYNEGKKQLKRADRKGEPIFQPYAEDLTAHAGKKLRSKTGRFMRSAFSTLSLETFKACLKILQDAPPSKNTRSERGGARVGARKKNTKK